MTQKFSLIMEKDQKYTAYKDLTIAISDFLIIQREKSSIILTDKQMLQMNRKLKKFKIIIRRLKRLEEIRTMREFLKSFQYKH